MSSAEILGRPEGPSSSGYPENAVNLVDTDPTWRAVMPYLTKVRMRAN